MELPGRFRGGGEPPPQLMSTDAHFWVKIGFKIQSLGKISNIVIIIIPVLTWYISEPAGDNNKKAQLSLANPRNAKADSTGLSLFI